MAFNLKTGWDSLSERIGFGLFESQNLYTTLVSLYSADGRRTHDLDHISQMLQELKGIRRQAPDPDSLELAVWFHDVMYLPGSDTNEARSARLAANMLLGAGLKEQQVSRISRYILATRQDAPKLDPGSMLISDLELCSLAFQFEMLKEELEKSLPARGAFPGYNERLRKENLLYFRNLAKRERIYLTDPFWKRYEAKARNNVRLIIQYLNSL